MDKVTIFRGRENFQAYLDAVRQVEAGTVSPGGAGMILGVSRQGIDKLIETGHLRAWLFYEGWPKPRCTYKEISVRDLIEYGVRTGRIESKADCGLGFPHLEEEINRAKLLLSTEAR